MSVINGACGRASDSLCNSFFKRSTLISLKQMDFPHVNCAITVQHYWCFLHMTWFSNGFAIILFFFFYSLTVSKQKYPEIRRTFEILSGSVLKTGLEQNIYNGNLRMAGTKGSKAWFWKVCIDSKIFWFDMDLFIWSHLNTDYSFSLHSDI